MTSDLDDRSVRFADNRRMLHRRPFYFAEYGSANKIAASNTGTAVWCLDAWFRGASGVLPWNTIGTKKSLEQAEQTALFYPCVPAGNHLQKLWRGACSIKKYIP
ncbi:MAG: hypothetical protein LC660_13710 [Desulfobacteraceae bacterium]|nr:hypothetical protein [Desulfobacteraceae bacterium]